MSAHTPVYEVTKEGRVISKTSNWRGYGSRELKQTLNDDGYPSVRIMVDGKRKHFSVHVLVAREHLPARPSPAHEIRHLDGNKLNPAASNLAWGTQKENADDRERHGTTSRGSRHASAIKKGIPNAFTAEEISAIKEMRGQGQTQRAIAQKLGRSQSGVRAIAKAIGRQP